MQSSLLHKTSSIGRFSSKPVPAVVLLHGRGANEEDLLGLAPYLDPRFLLIAARAPFAFPFGGYTWYDVVSVGTPHPDQFRESYERLVLFLQEIKSTYPIDEERFFLLGFSMGTVMSYAHALTHPDEIAGVVAHSGYIPEDTPLTFQWEKLDGKGFFVAHGSQDPVIGVEFGRRAHELLAKAKADLTYKEYEFPHTMSEESVSDFSRWLAERVHGRPHGS